MTKIEPQLAKLDAMVDTIKALEDNGLHIEKRSYDNYAYQIDKLRAILESEGLGSGRVVMVLYPYKVIRDELQAYMTEWQMLSIPLGAI